MTLSITAMVPLASQVPVCQAQAEPAADGATLAQTSGMARSITVDIPAQPLDSALTTFADQAVLRILFSSDDVAGLEATALRGRNAAEEALRRLLAGSGLGRRARCGEPLPSGGGVGANAVTTPRRWP